MINHEISGRATSEPRSWLAAYVSFLRQKGDFMLKVAPLALILGSPEVVASNLIPVVGEVADIGGLVLAATVAYRTLQAVREQR